MVLTQSRQVTEALTDDGNEGSDEEGYWAKRCVKDDTGGKSTSVREEVTTAHEAGDFDDDEECEFDEEDLIAQVDQFAKDPSNIDLNTDDLLEEAVPRTKDANYVFCPPEHCLPLLRLFAKHHALHPLLSEQHGQKRTAEEIYRDSGLEMYTHCECNHLCEV